MREEHLQKKEKKMINNLKDKDLAYFERDQLVLYLSKLFPSWLERHPDNDLNWENDWRNIVFIQFPEGLFSWHIADYELDYFNHLSFKEGNSWGGETSEQKYDLLRQKTSTFVK